MATITVVSPKTVYPGADSFFAQFTEANNTTVAALRWVVLNAATPPKWLAISSDAPNILGTNMVAGVNATSGLVATDIFVYVPGTIIEANSNSATDLLIGTSYDTVVSSNDHQIDQTDTTGGSEFVPIRLSPKHASGDTNARHWGKFATSVLNFSQGL